MKKPVQLAGAFEDDVVHGSENSPDRIVVVVAAEGSVPGTAKLVTRSRYAATTRTLCASPAAVRWDIHPHRKPAPQIAAKHSAPRW